MLSAAAVALAMNAPSAQAASSYVSLFGGVSFLDKMVAKGQVRTTGSTWNENIQSSFKTGYVIGGNWGVDWGHFRTELELALHQNNSASHAKYISTYSGYGPYTTSADFKLSAYSLMANAWYDFHDILPGGVTPYVGGGVGLAEVQLSGKFRGHKLNMSNDTVFAWQVGAGVSVPISDSLKAYVDYRYFSTGNAQVAFRNAGLFFGGVSTGFQSHSVLVGLRLSL
jgi:opacity protein-like surface antigen